jgi:hypothetical protein
MSVIIPIGYANVALNFQVAGRSRQYAITFGIRPDVGLTNPDGMATLVDGAFTSTGSPGQSAANILDSYTYLGVTLTYMSGTGAFPGTHSHVLTGTATAGGMPPNAAYLVRKVTSRGGRQGRGRMYVPPFNLSEISVDSAGFMSPATAANLSNQYEEFRNSMVTAGVTMVLLHDTPKSGVLPAPDTVNTLVVEQSVATQKRRIRR